MTCAFINRPRDNIDNVFFTQTITNKRYCLSRTNLKVNLMFFLNAGIVKNNFRHHFFSYVG